MKASQKLGISFLIAVCIWQSANAFGQVFESNRDYLCVTEEALFAAPKISQHGEWADPPSRFHVQIKTCETFCLPQRSKDKPLSLLLKEPEANWPQKYEGYRGRADYHSIEGGSVILSRDDLSLTRTIVGSLPGAEQQASLVLNAQCYPID